MAVRSLKITNSCQFLFTGSEDRHLKKWNAITGDLLQDFGAIYSKWVYRILITLDDQFLFTASIDSKLKQFYLGE